MSRGKSYRAVISGSAGEALLGFSIGAILALPLAIFLLFFYQGDPATGVVEPAITAQAAITEIPPQANGLERLTNEQREANDLPTLATSELLRQSACHKAADMVKHDYFAHVAPDGTEPWHYFREAGYTYRFAGENLARNFTDEAALVQAWMESPTHRDNVLGDFEEQGICSVEGVTVQHLGVRG